MPPLPDDQRKMLAMAFVLAGLDKTMRADYGGSGVWHIRNPRDTSVETFLRAHGGTRTGHNDPALWGSAARVRLETAQWPELGAIAYALDQGPTACPFTYTGRDGLREHTCSKLGPLDCPWIENGLMRFEDKYPRLKQLQASVDEIPPVGLIDC